MKTPVTFKAATKDNQELISQMIKSLYKYRGAKNDYMTDHKIKIIFDYLLSQQLHWQMEVF